jgi:hydroxymethylglutaryl-CoA lyase
MTRIVIHEVGLRDGLQMEAQAVPIERKAKWLRGFVDAGIDIIQVGSFVHPDKVPQMADTDRLFALFSKPDAGSRRSVLSGLVLNEKGLERGLGCGVEMFCMGVSASETHSRKNTGMPVAEAAGRILGMAAQVAAAGKRLQLSVQSAFGCGYEGRISEGSVLGLVRRFLESGFKQISLADTAGHATPDQVARMFEAVFRLDPAVECTCHLHNTYGLGLANCYAAMKAGVTTFESSVAGLGGCPFTKVAGGNICTEDFVHSLQRVGVRTDLRLGGLIEIARDVAAYFGREMPGMVHKSGPVSYRVEPAPGDTVPPASETETTH